MKMGISRARCAILIALMVLQATGTGYTAPAAGDFDYLGEQDGFIFYAVSDLQFAASGSVQTWLLLRPEWKARTDMIQARLDAGLEPGRLGDVDELRCRVQVDPVAGRILVLEQLYFDSQGNVISEWTQTALRHGLAEPPAALVENASISFIRNYLLWQARVHTSRQVPCLTGLPWGTAVEAVPDAVLVGPVNISALTAYDAEIDNSVLLGNNPQVGKTRLVFSSQRGLVAGECLIDAEHFPEVAAHLAQVYGQPERLDDVYRWYVGEDTVLELKSPLGSQINGVLNVFEYQFWLAEAFTIPESDRP